VHSWVDTGGAFLVLAAARTARREPDEDHPLGFGRESYVWSLLASLAMLIIGAVVGVWHGIDQLGASDGGSHYAVGYLVILVSFVFEGVAFARTLRDVRAGAAEFDRTIFEHAFRTANSPMRAVFAEDFIALIGLAIAAAGIGLHQLTGEILYDALGSIVIGGLLGVVALVLIVRNGSYLSGKLLAPDINARLISTIKSYPELERVTFVHSEIIGPTRLLVIVGARVAGEHSQAELAAIIRTVERRIMEGKYVGFALLTLATSDEPEVVVESTEGISPV
jgi:cation diffusion facilitator family transporter